MRFHSFLEILDHYAALSADAIALVYEKDGERIEESYTQLATAVRERAGKLKAAEGRLEAILTDGSRECIVEVFAAAAAGLPVALLDADAPDETLLEQLKSCGAGLVWGDEDLCEDLGYSAAGPSSARPGDVLIFTSGTTSRAKAVVLTEGSLCASAYNGGALLPLSEEDRLLCMLPLSHVFGFVCGLLWGLSCGASVALGRGPRHYLDDLSYFRPTAISVVPLLLGFLVQRKLVNAELKLILVGAGDCPAALLEAVKALGIRVSFGYGLTETSSGVALSLGDDPYAMTICPDDRIRIAEDGEILIDAPTCRMTGYYGDPEATEAAFENGWLKSGDLGQLTEDGLLHITGRKKDMLVYSDGTKLFLPEAEGQLAELLPGEDMALYQKDGKTLLALGGSQKTEEALWAAIAPWQGERPRSQQIAAITIREDALPRTATGKVKRWEL